MTNKQKIAAANRRSREKLASTTAGAQVGAITAGGAGAMVRRYTDPLPVVGDAGYTLGMAALSYALSFAGNKGGFARASLQTAGATFLGQALDSFLETMPVDDGDE